MLGLAQDSISSLVPHLLLVGIGTLWSQSWLSTYPSTLHVYAPHAASHHYALHSFAVWQYATMPRGFTTQAASRTVWSILHFCWLHEASGHGCCPHWLQPSWMCLGSMSWYCSVPIPWDGARWGAPTVLGKLVLHTFPHPVETNARAMHWLYSVCCTDLQPRPASDPPESKGLSGTMQWYVPLMTSYVQDFQRWRTLCQVLHKSTLLSDSSAFSIWRGHGRLFYAQPCTATATTSGLALGRHEWQRTKPSAHM